MFKTAGGVLNPLIIGEVTTELPVAERARMVEVGAKSDVCVCGW